MTAMNDAPTLPLYDWRIAEDDAPAASVPGLPAPITRLIARRGLADVTDEDDISTFLDNPIAILSKPEAKPSAMPGVDEAAKTILDVIGENGQIVVFGDFDCDGITATAILTAMLRYVGADVLPFIPKRSEGYGLTNEAVSRCLATAQEARPDTTRRLLVTVDCGMGAGPALQRFLDAGYRVVVSDHHTPGTPLPEACIIISTFNPDAPACCRHLCGAGLAYTIAGGVIEHRYPLPDKTGRDELHQWTAPLAIATIADVVPLVDVNRAYVREGLNILNRRPGTGLKALIRKAFKNTPDQISAYHLGFVLGPHINASGRLESAEPALRLLLATNADDALAEATLLYNLNNERQRTEKLLLTEIDGQLADRQIFNPVTDGATVIAGKGWSPGIVGLAAGRLTERLSRPSVVIAVDDNGDAHGSARAPEGVYNLYDALSACSSLLTRFGGHASAAGLSLREADIPAFRKAFTAECLRQAGATHVRGGIVVDGALAANDVNDAFMQALHRLEPCGNANETPCWMLADVHVTATPIGQDKTHLRLRLQRKDGLDLGGIWFGAARFAPLFERIERWDVVGELAENEFRKKKEIQLSVRDARPHV